MSYLDGDFYCSGCRDYKSQEELASVENKKPLCFDCKERRDRKEEQHRRVGSLKRRNNDSEA